MSVETTPILTIITDHWPAAVTPPASAVSAINAEQARVTATMPNGATVTVTRFFDADDSDDDQNVGVEATGDWGPYADLLGPWMRVTAALRQGLDGVVAQGRRAVAAYSNGRQPLIDQWCVALGKARITFLAGRPRFLSGLGRLACFAPLPGVGGGEPGRRLHPRSTPRPSPSAIDVNQCVV